MTFPKAGRALFRGTVVFGVILLSIANTACAAKVVSGSESDAQKQLDNLTISLANGSVESIDILHMPDGTETRASVRPENLERWWESRITLGKVSEWAGRDELVATMNSTKTDSNPRMPDLRSAIIFNDSH